MSEADDFKLSVSISSTLGLYATILDAMEPQIDQVLEIVARKAEENPDNPAAPIMRDVLIKAKEFAAAHRKYQQVANMMMSGNMHLDATDKIQ